MALGRGGKRKGAGRKPGPRLTATEKLAKLVQLDPRALTSTIEPKEVMLQIMRHHFARNEHQLAIRAAIAVSPYIHPRLSSIEVSPMDPTGAVPGLVDLSKADSLEVVRRLAFVFYMAGRQQPVPEHANGSAGELGGAGK
jgi:hypothetical protein